MPFRLASRAALSVALLLSAAAPQIRGFAATLTAAPVVTSKSLPPAPTLRARSAILVEARTGAVLFEKNPDVKIAPASLTKLMTLHIVLEQIAAGRLDPKREIVPDKGAWAKSMPAGSSLMFLGPRQKVSIEQLLKGLVVDSGNDAAVALAQVVAGSVPAFAVMMNQEAEDLGYGTMHFVEPAGLSPANTVTARDYADFCRFFVSNHPEALASLFSLKEFTYPLAENLTEGNNEAPVTQHNRNVLLDRYEGADGLKTGHIDESGYNIAVTALRSGMRLISVILGVPGAGAQSGEAIRAAESEALLDYGFNNFVLLPVPQVTPAAVKVWKGRARSVALSVRGGPPSVTVPKSDAAEVRARVEQEKQVMAPVLSGQLLGHIVVTLNGTELVRFPLVAAKAVPRGSLLRRALDSVLLLFQRG